MLKVTQLVEQALWAGALCCGLVSAAAWEQAHAAERLAQRAAATPTAAAVPTTGDASDVQGAVLAQLRIPALGLIVPVVEGDGTEDLLRGVGHIPGTALPGGLGTVALAGHRDTFLRPLERLQLHTAIDVTQGGATYRYLVDSTKIVRPDQVGVLGDQDTPALVLITCYPFHYIGHAPLRFVVSAHLVSLLPERAPTQ